MKFRFLFISLCFAFFAKAQTNHWETAVYENDTWRYEVPTAEPDSNWRKISFNASSWQQGQGGFGFGDGDDNTVITSNVSVYHRISFNVTDTSKINSAVLNVDYDDGFVAYLNNVEIARANMTPAGPPPYNTLASANHEAVMYNGGNPDYFILTPSQLHAILVNGTNVLSIQTHNVTVGSSDLSSRVWLSFGIRDNSVLFGTPPSWFVPPFEFYDSNLPVVVINTNNQTISDDPKIMADMGIVYNGIGNRNNLEGPFNNYNGKIGIELRGSSSQWIYPKKSYGFETWDVNGNAIDSSLLGMPKEKDWVLISAYSDKTQMRNEMTYWMWEQMGYYAPRGQPVELVINGIYQGIYFLGEKIKQDNDRVDIANLQPVDIYGDELTGGYILKVDKLTGNGSNYWPSLYPAPNNANTPVNIIVHHPNDSTIMPQQLAYIHAYSDSFEIALNGNNFEDTAIGWRHYANEQSFVDYFLITEFSKNLDAYRSSCYFFKDKNSNGGKLKMGPVWDYDLAYGNADFCDTWLTNGWAYNFNYVCSGDSWLVPFWWERLVQDSAFGQNVRCRWEELKVTLFNPIVMDAYIDSMAQYLNESQQRNYQVWPIIGVDVWPNYYVAQTYQGEADTLKWWMHQRFNFMDANLPGNPALCNVTGMASPENNPNAIHVFPNPFNEEINIELLLTEPADVQIEILDLLGQSIGETQTQYHSGGLQQLKINTGSELPAGIYFVRVRSGNTIWVRQISKA